MLNSPGSNPPNSLLVSLNTEVNGLRGLSGNAAYGGGSFNTFKVTIAPGKSFTPPMASAVAFVADTDGPLQVTVGSFVTTIQTIMLNDSGGVPTFTNNGLDSVNLKLSIVG